MVFKGDDSLSMDKAVIFIVEGATDKRALENIFKKIYRYKDIHFEFTHGDISSDDNIDKNNVEEEIYKYVNKYIKDKKLKISDIWQIIQIFDTDGTYVHDSNIKKGDSTEIVYSTEYILCKNRQKVIDRNMHKREIMDYLLGLDNIKKIPYRCFYLSSNLDHALYNQLNLDDELKSKYSQAFYEQFMGKETLFIQFLDMEVVNGVPDAFAESWRYIREGVNSLQRHTNLNIYFKENPPL